MLTILVEQIKMLLSLGKPLALIEQDRKKLSEKTLKLILLEVERPNKLECLALASFLTQVYCLQIWQDQVLVKHPKVLHSTLIRTSPIKLAKDKPSSLFYPIVNDK